MSCGVRRRHGSDPALLWLWYRLVATAPIRPLAWELHMPWIGPRKGKKTKNNNNKKTPLYKPPSLLDCELTLVTKAGIHCLATAAPTTRRALRHTHTHTYTYAMLLHREHCGEREELSLLQGDPAFPFAGLEQVWGSKNYFSGELVRSAAVAAALENAQPL